MTDDIDYSVPGPLTGLATISREALKSIPDEPVDICRPAHSLVIHPDDAKSLGLPDDRFAENQIRPVAALIEAILALDSAPLDIPRSPDRKVIGTCRHFAVLSCAAAIPGRRSEGPLRVRHLLPARAGPRPLDYRVLA